MIESYKNVTERVSDYIVVLGRVWNQPRISPITRIKPRLIPSPNKFVATVRVAYKTACPLLELVSKRKIEDV